ncbi:Transmembrane protein 240 [Collichthys lucidus]|uniref:Transmembrane protein 240 n=1 Tax=Collichthys lucidus TaxID=240159 RepID=A0A4V6AN91_COLLU|nr:Transmembrane protein 240 [Collichthys lucidus]
MDINALLHRFQNFIVLFIEGKDGVCDCTCGRHQAHHVIPFNEIQHMVANEGNYVSMAMMTGVIVGLCISWFLQWLQRARLKYWRRN